MCGRYELDPDNEEVKFLVASIQDVFPLAEMKTGEIFPTDVVPVLAYMDGGIMPLPMGWGFPRWDGKGVVFNARSETALEKPMFRRSLEQRRIAVPTTRFYEWKASPEGRKRRYLFRTEDSGLLYLGGIFNLFNEAEMRFTILTTEANTSMVPYHNRMPVLLRREEIDAWIRGRDWEALLRRVPFALNAVAG